MTIVERLQQIVKERGTNFKQLELDCGIGNGVIRRWDVQSPRLDKLVKVANYLNVSLDYLVHGEEPTDGPRAECDDAPLSPKERDLIAMFRCLSDAAQKELYELVYFKYTRLIDGEKDSIYWTYAADELKAKSTAVSDGKAQGGIA